MEKTRQPQAKMARNGNGTIAILGGIGNWSSSTGSSRSLADGTSRCKSRRRLKQVLPEASCHGSGHQVEVLVWARGSSRAPLNL